MRPYLPPGTPPLDVSVRVDGVLRTTWRFAEGTHDTWRDVPIPEGDARTRVITFSFSATRSPAAVGEGGDARELALGLVGACVERIGCPRG